jgi:hypothetical protein
MFPGADNFFRQECRDPGKQAASGIAATYDTSGENLGKGAELGDRFYAAAGIARRMPARAATRAPLAGFNTPGIPRTPPAASEINKFHAVRMPGTAFPVDQDVRFKD